MPIPPAQPYPLQLATGPYSYLLSSVLGESEPFNAAILASDGSYYYMQFVGSRDRRNKLLGCTGQTCIGEPTFQAPAGAEIYDTLNEYKWVSNGWNGGTPADGIDSPIRGMITASNFLGWTAFCPCVSNNPPPSGSGSGAGGGGGGGGNRIVTPCCPGGVSQTLFLNFQGQGACQSCVLGNHTISWSSVLGEWLCDPITCNHLYARFALTCPTNTGLDFSVFRLTLFWSQSIDFPIGAVSSIIWQAETFTCSPFSISSFALYDTSFANGVPDLCPGDLSSYSITVDD